MECGETTVLSLQRGVRQRGAVARLHTDPLRSLADYELFIYSLTEAFPAIQQSSLVLVRKGASLARVEGEIRFAFEIRLVVRERLMFDRLPGRIEGYGYEVWRGSEKLFWYDPQPHPQDSTLRSTEPHHKHVQPDIRHNRIPAPLMRFERPNLPALIREIEELLVSLGSPPSIG